MTYELDATAERSEANSTDDRTEAPTDGQSADSSLGVTIPDDHVGAFVAEALEDPERSTSWDEVVDAMVAPGALDDWRELSRVERAAAVLEKATEYDRLAADRFDAVPLDADENAVRADVDEGLRCRGNADAFRDGVAAAYADGLLDDDDLVAALESAEFETAAIERREELLERIDGVYDVEFSPYGGTLMDTEDGGDDSNAETDRSETW